MSELLKGNIHVIDNQNAIADFKQIWHISMNLTLILLEPEVISLYHQYRPRPHCKSVLSDQALYCWLTISKSLKMLMERFQTRKLDYSIKEIQQVEGKKGYHKG